MTNLEKIQKIFDNVFDDCPSIDENTSKENFELWDSLNHLSLVLEIESELGISLDIEQIEQLKSVKDILALLK
jgi:acyl carrier protein